MHLRFFAVLLLFALSAQAQSPSRQAVRGSKCSIVPPAGFTPSGAFNGFQDAKNGASIMVTEVPGPFNQVIAGFTPEAMKSQNMTLIAKESIELKPFQALVLKVSQTAYGNTFLKDLLIFGNATKTVLVAGTYPEVNKQLGPAIRASVLSVKYDESFNADPLGAVNFKVDTAGTDFGFSNAMSGTLSFKRKSTGASFLAGSSLGSAPGLVDKRAYTLTRLEKLPLPKPVTVIETRAVTIGNFDGFEVSAVSGDKKNLLLTMLYTPEDGYYMFLGQSLKNAADDLAEFRKLTATFRMK